MPGLRGPSDYSQEPPRHPSLVVNAKRRSSKCLNILVYVSPFNAEPRRLDLVSSYVTPVEFFYKRNHGTIPIVDDLEKYSFSVTGRGSPVELFMKDIWKLPKYTVTATLQDVGCLWGAYGIKGEQVDALYNNMIACFPTSILSIWAGVKLADVLELVGVPKCSRVTPYGQKHVEFVSIDKCKEENGGPYKASIPLIQATSPEADVLLAYEMNGETLNRDHGYPLRMIVPGVIGARSVKWLDSINIIEEECQGFFMQKDYKMFPPSVNWDNIIWPSRRPQMYFPVQLMVVEFGCSLQICSLDDVSMVKSGKITIKGYAVSGGGRGIERVDISIDGGKTWVEASKSHKPGIPYIPDDESNDKWSWVLFEAEANIPHNAEIVAKQWKSFGT